MNASKKYIHLCDNYDLDTSDKFAKITPLNNLMNQTFLQFGAFAFNLSIDEQMIAYFGRHSSKMFIKGKPIRFGSPLLKDIVFNIYLNKVYVYI